MSTPSVLIAAEFACDSSIYTYASSFVKSFTRLGYAVTVFNTKKNHLPCGGAMHYDLAGLRQRLNNLVINYRLQKLVQASAFDVIFIMKGENLSFSTLRNIRMHHQGLFINFYPDNPFVVWNGNSNGDVLRSLPLYDCFLSWSHMLLPLLYAAGCRRVEYFPFAFDEELFTCPLVIAADEEQNYRSDVCFVGSWDVDREQWLTHVRERLPSLDIAVWGDRWHERLAPTSQLRSCIRGPALYGQAMRKAFHGAKIVLNFIRRQNMTSHNMRTFEVLATGGFLLTERTVEQASLLFKEGRDLVCFGDNDELIHQIVRYKEHNDERKKIAVCGANTVRQFDLTTILRKTMHALGVHAAP